MEQKMADLPAERVSNLQPPFTHVGVDYFGPFNVKVGRSQVKRYGCIFTCMACRAIHLEVAHSMDTDSFVNALQRFIARRGKPVSIKSDNGTNFVGAERELRESIEAWNSSHIEEHLKQQGIKWKFNPPHASHMGGVWERQIRTVRRVLSALMREQQLDDERLSTLLCVVEAVVNSCPLTHVSDDAKDLEPITPNHLLLLRAGEHLPPGEFVEQDQYVKRRWRQVQFLSDIFWKRWTREYLPELQRRQKWTQIQQNLQVNDIVIVMDDGLPRNMWQLGRIIDVHRGQDGLVRSANVKTQHSVLSRPIAKLCLLETVDMQ